MHRIMVQIHPDPKMFPNERQLEKAFSFEDFGGQLPRVGEVLTLERSKGGFEVDVDIRTIAHNLKEKTVWIHTFFGGGAIGFDLHKSWLLEQGWKAEIWEWEKAEAS